MLYHGKSDSLVSVRTRSGRKVRVTPVHRLFQVAPDGSLRERMARDLQPGDYIASIRRIPESETAEALKIKLAPVRANGHTIPVPERMTPMLAEFLGLYISEGYIRSRVSVVFTNGEESMRRRFATLAKVLFNLDSKIRFRKDGRNADVIVNSVQLVELLDQLGCGRGSWNKHIPPSVLEAPNDCIGAFLRGYYLGDGTFYYGTVEMLTASASLRTELTYALARFGILTHLARRAIDGKEYQRVLIRGISNLARFVDSMRSVDPKIELIHRYLESKSSTYTATDVVPLSRNEIERLYRSQTTYTALIEDGIEIHNYIGNGERMGASTFSRFMAHRESVSGPVASESSSAARLANLLDWIFCDEVVEVTEDTSGPFDVYDVAVPEFGSNFVGGIGGVLLHNTVIQQQLAKWADSDVVVYVGCGERGNEMTEVLATFPTLVDPKSKRPLMERTILIANTSNMPVAAREASVYTGITIAEYYRDMGYDVALMADSTSRWAEAMREISGRLEEMPGEEGYPAYLGRRIAEFYERAGRVVTLSPEQRTGSITVVGAVSPAGGDTSEPVSQNTLRVARVFWALDASLASRRHFPSINWLQSYSLYINDLAPWFGQNLSKEFVPLRQKALEVLQKEAELQEIVQLVGVDALPEREKAILDVARMLREDYLQQSAYDDVDTYSSIQKQYRMLRAILNFGDREQDAIGKGATVAQLQKLPVRTKLSRMKWIPEAELQQQFEALDTEMGQAVGQVAAAGGA